MKIKVAYVQMQPERFAVLNNLKKMHTFIEKIILGGNHNGTIKFKKRQS